MVHGIYRLLYQVGDYVSTKGAWVIISIGLLCQTKVLLLAFRLKLTTKIKIKKKKLQLLWIIHILFSWNFGKSYLKFLSREHDYDDWWLLLLQFPGQVANYDKDFFLRERLYYELVVSHNLILYTKSNEMVIHKITAVQFVISVWSNSSKISPIYRFGIFFPYSKTQVN